MDHQRFAIYAAPRPSPLADAAAAWLGWDCQRGHRPVPIHDMPAFPPEVTAAPRKYGFHATLKAPFRLMPGVTAADLDRAVAELAQGMAPVILPGLALQRLGGFLALVPDCPAPTLMHLAGQVVRQLEPFRAPLNAFEIARRKPERLTERQRGHLIHWGYPYVMEEFRFHMTLTDDLSVDQSAAVAAALQRWLMPLVPRPFAIQDLCLFGEAEDGRFHLIARHALTG